MSRTTESHDPVADRSEIAHARAWAAGETTLPPTPSEHSSRGTDALKSRELLRSVAGKLAALTGLLAYCERKTRCGVTILMYHRVLPADRIADGPLKHLVMPASVFREQILWLAANCMVLPLEEAIHEEGQNRQAARRLVCVTFDDGYADNYRFAVPILEDAGLRATLFVTTDYVAGNGVLWHDWGQLLWMHAPREALTEVIRHGHRGVGDEARELACFDDWMAALRRLRPDTRAAVLEELGNTSVPTACRAHFSAMTVEQLIDLSERGHEIASHTLTHEFLPALDDAELARQITHSRGMLEDWLGRSVRGFSYPFGVCDDRVVEAVQAAGYAHACTTEVGLNTPGTNPLRLKRLGMWPNPLTKSGRHDELRFRCELAFIQQFLRRAKARLRRLFPPN